ncbi:zinc finger protein 638 isoform X2 [Apus apus]|uniref:zinc finger protein 638 isoform X2 n=1 Tax=Apus apus TaxID=8895 RepID=UPI0021F8F68B|nr:zinc finger protein 638 isoform X2 [Apus apus]
MRPLPAAPRPSPAHAQRRLSRSSGPRIPGRGAGPGPARLGSAGRGGGGRRRRRKAEGKGCCERRGSAAAPRRSFVLFLESFAPLVNSLNLGIGSPLLLGPPPLQLAQIKTQLALQQLTSLATSSSAPPHAWFNQALLKSTMFSPRGTLPPRPRGPNPAGTKPPGSFRGGGAGGLQRKPAAGTPQGAPQRFSGQESFQWTGSQRINVRVTLHRADPRQVKEKTNLHQEQKGEPHTSCWDSNPRPAVTTGQKPSASTRIPEQNSNAQNRYTPESASSILASFGLSNEDLEELSRYPDEQLTPENMPLILREIRIRKMGHSSSRVHPQSRGEEPVGGPSGAAVKSKVIDYGHASKYGYTEDPLEVRPYNPEALPAEPLEPRVYNPEAPSGENREDFQREQNMSMSVSSSSVTCNPVFPVEELIKPTGFQSDSSNAPSFFPAETPGKVSGLCVAPSGLTVVTSVSQPAIPLVMPPMVPPVSQPAVPPVLPPMVPPVSQPAVPPVMPPMMPPVSQPAIPPVMPPVLPPVSQPAVPPVMPPMMPPMITPLAPMLAPVMLTFVQQSMTQHVMPPISHPPFSPELLAKLSQHERSQHESGTSQSVAPSAPGAGQKPFQPKAEGPIKSPFGIVKASWLPAFLQADSQKIQRLPTPSMMNDYYATSPRIFPHMCSLCNIECTHMKDWILHQNTPSHIESCCQLRQQYPDWNPESHSSKRNAGERKENQTPKRRSNSASPSPRRSRFSSSSHVPRRSRSRSPGRFRPARPRSRSPRQMRRLSLRHRSRSPQRSRNPLRTHSRARRSSSSDRSSRRPTRSQDRKSALEEVVKSLGPGFVAEYNKHKSLQAAGQGSSGLAKSSPSHGTSGKKPGNVKKPPKTSGSLKASKKDVPSVSGSSSSPGTDDLPQSKETEENEGGSSTEPSAPRPVPYNRLLRKELLSCGTVLQITGLPDDGFSDQDIKKIVQPFGKVSDFLVLRSKNMAFLEMNYKEAVIAAVKYGKTVPVLVNGKQVKISVAEKPKVSSGQAKTSIRKKAQSIKKVAPSIKKEKKTTSKTTKPIAGKKEKTKRPTKTGVSKPKKTSNTAAKPVAAEFQTSAEAEMEAGDTKLPDPKNVPEGDRVPVSVKTEEAEPEDGAKPPAALEVPHVAALDVDGLNQPSTDQATKVTSKSEEPPEQANKELDDTCVVVISNLPEKGYSVEEVSNLAKPFGGLRDVLILSSHKKAYMEISRKSADSMVKFYTCFPMSLDGNQLSIRMGPQWSTVRDEEAIFTAIIKDSDPKVNTETLHNQFVHLGNLPADGYRELEVVCVGLRFGKVDHYVVLKNKNKAILQLDSPKSARSMYSFLKQYPYSMGEHTLTCTLSPRGEAAEADPVAEEVKPEEPSPASSGLKKYPEGSGVVQTAAANPPVEPSVAQEGPVAICHVKDQMSAVQLEPSESQLDRALRESPAQTSVEDLDAGVEATVVSIKPTSTQSPEGKPEEMQPPPASVQEEEAVKDSAHPELLEPAAVSSSEKEIKEKGEELPAPPVEPAQELSDGGKAEDVPSDGAAGGHLGAVPEPVPPGSDAASVKMVSPVVTPANHKSDAPENNPVSDPVKTKDEMPVTQITEKKPMLKTGAAEEKKLDVAGADTEVKPEESALKAGRAAEENPDKLLVKAGAETEKKTEKIVASVGIAVENTANAVSENSEGSLINTQQNKETGLAKTDETHQPVTFNSSLSAKEPSSVGITLLKAVVSLPDILKSRVPVRRKKPLLCKGGGKKAPLKPKPQGQAVVEKKMAHKEEDHPQPGSSQASPGDGSSKCKVSRSSVGGGKGGNGRNSSQQEKDSRVESRASSKQSQEGESRSSSMKTDNSSNKAPVGGNAKASRSGSSSSAKQKEEEELFPFNLDEFVTVDEVVEEVESPVKTRRNPPRVKRKVGAKTTSSSEPGSKRRKGKSSVARLPESELSFVTLDEIGEEEEVAAQLMAVTNLEVLSDPQGLVVVDEVMEEEELLSEAVKDPQSLVTLDEISEQEDLGSRKGVPGSAFEEQDLKAEPLVTVDEIGEVEELPLNEPTDLSLEEVPKQKDKVAAEKAGSGASSQVPDDPSALLTVDEIQEDSEDNPLVTLDEVNEDEDDFLADFNRLKEELNFVTVDEVGEEDEEEENTLPGTNVKEDEDKEDSVAVAGPEEEENAAIAGPEGEEVVAVAGPEEMQVLRDTSPEEERTATPKSKVDQLGSGDKDPVSKQKKKAPSEASKTQSTPRDLDYLLPKAGFFCQICSLFYADETSVKNHCKTALHQQNMEKFMAKQQQQEDNDGEEQSSR